MQLLNERADLTVLILTNELQFNNDLMKEVMDAPNNGHFVPDE